jgi:hypothetical protein
MKLGIKKIEYRHKDAGADAPWTQLNIVKLSCTLSEEWTEEPAGMVSSVTIEAKIRWISEIHDRTMEYLMRYPNHYRLTDMNGVQYLLGDDDYIPRLTYVRSIAQLNPNGYSVKITFKSPHGLKITNA